VKSRPVWSTVIAATALASCSASMPPLPTSPSPLVVANCPSLSPLTDDSFGATTRKLLEVVETYYRCRAAALQ
jgi:hypothetical protein